MREWLARLLRRRRLADHEQVIEEALRPRVFAGAIRYARARERLRETPIETHDTIGEVPPTPLVRAAREGDK